MQQSTLVQSGLLSLQSNSINDSNKELVQNNTQNEIVFKDPRLMNFKELQNYKYQLNVDNPFFFIKKQMNQSNDPYLRNLQKEPISRFQQYKQQADELFNYKQQYLYGKVQSEFQNNNFVNEYNKRQAEDRSFKQVDYLTSHINNSRIYLTQSKQNLKTDRSKNIYDDIPIISSRKDQNKNQIQIYNSEQQTIECPEGCGRYFTQEALEKHVKVCQKIFQQKRQEFNSKKQRQIVSEQQQKLQKNNKIPNQKSKWKQQSEDFRKMLAYARKSEDLQEQKEQVLIICPACGKKYNEKIAEKHIPSCMKRNR